VAQKDLHKLHPQCDIVQQLLRGGLMGADLLRTFVSHHVQPLRPRGMTVRMYPGPNCPVHPFSVELGDTELADLNFGSGLIPLREGVKSPWVSPLDLTLV
jgi:hypothetical protein